MTKPDPSERLSFEQMLTTLRLVSPRDIAVSKQQALKTGLPLARTLVLSQLIDQATLERLLRLQAIQRGCKLPLQVVIDAFGYATREGLTIEQGLAKAGVYAQIVSYSRLGTLLVDSGLISKQQLDDAQKLAYQTRLALGSMLTMHGAISQAQLNLALDLQKQLREQTITKDQALAQLSSSGSTDKRAATAAFDDRASAVAAEKGAAEKLRGREVAPVPQDPDNKINLGELLVIAGVITEFDADAAFERSLTNNLSLAENLLQMQVCSPALVDIALELQKHVSNGDVSLPAAVESLSYIEDYR